MDGERSLHREVGWSSLYKNLDAILLEKQKTSSDSFQPSHCRQLI